jgi:UDP-N-acetylmuramoyl-L-alanyl-D-glutamate--2,6-diaminopimelate ligase
MLTGAPGLPDHEVVVEVDRGKAIGLAIAAAGPGDVVLIVGRGHETTQSLGGRTVPFDDREQARAALTALGWADGDDASPWQPGVKPLPLGVARSRASLPS